MIKDSADGESWFYRFQGTDYTAILAGTYDIEFRLTFTDGYQATIPTQGTCKLIVEAVLA